MLSNITTETITHESYVMAFEWNDCPGAGFSFPCNADGSMDLSGREGRLENLAGCLFGVFDVTYKGIEDWSRTWTERSGKCVCGRTVDITEPDYGHGIDCECGRIYNSSGQELAPRSQWEDRYDEDSTQPYNVEFGHAGRDY